jgi:branched-chain amino acid transport system permease protein
MNPLGRHLPVLIAAVVLIGVQLALSASGGVYYMTSLIVTAYCSLVAVGLCLLMGYAGQASLGHAGFFAIGGYTSAVLTTYNLAAIRDTPWVNWCLTVGLCMERQDAYGTAIVAITPWVAFLVALVVAALVGLLIGLPLIRLKGHYLAMATLGFGLIVYRLVLAVPVLGQADGIQSVPPLRLAGLEVNGRVAFRVENYYIAWGVMLLTMVLATNLVRSRVGRALRAIHLNEDAADSLGVNINRYKLGVFVLSAVLAAAGGSLLAHYDGSIGPSEATVMKSVRYVAIVAVGGTASLWGVLLTSLVLNFLSFRGVFGTYDDAVFGALLIVMITFLPGGLLRPERLRKAAAFVVGRLRVRRAS